MAWRLHFHNGSLTHKIPDSPYESVSHARRSIGQYIELYNRKRPHSSLADQTPDEAYFATLPAIKSAA
ncbi:integrase core domain-containing protein [Pandoraea sputorum]|uniref:integrase core domain-containing protein n=1 Tax=Pandoraea sputorum TaxID=93222 RepID=UPI001242C9E9|nr:integrase core domain-containing protein [Pandoraea sputorum]